MELNVPPGAGISWISTAAAAAAASRRAGSSRASSIGRSTDEAPILLGGLGVCLRDGVLQISLAAVEADFEAVVASAAAAVARLGTVVTGNHLPVDLCNHKSLLVNYQEIEVSLFVTYPWVGDVVNGGGLVVEIGGIASRNSPFLNVDQLVVGCSTGFKAGHDVTPGRRRADVGMDAHEVDARAGQSLGEHVVAVALVAANAAGCDLDVGVGDVLLEVCCSVAEPVGGIIVGAVRGELEGLVLDIKSENGRGPVTPCETAAWGLVSQDSLDTSIILGLGLGVAVERSPVGVAVNVTAIARDTAIMDVVAIVGRDDGLHPLGGQLSEDFVDCCQGVPVVGSYGRLKLGNAGDHVAAFDTAGAEPVDPNTNNFGSIAGKSVDVVCLVRSRETRKKVQAGSCKRV